MEVMPSRRAFCEQLGEHQFRPGDTPRCIHCGQLGSRRLPHRPRASEVKAALVDSHKRPWLYIRRHQISCCFYCRHPFTEDRPPTFDHVIPHSDGGSFGDGFVMSCQTCNSARGTWPFDAYLEAVLAEHEQARAEQREYRRPKARLLNGRMILTTWTRSQVRALR